MLVAANATGSQAVSVLKAATAVMAGLGSIGLSSLLRGMLDMAADWDQESARRLLRTGEVLMSVLAAVGVVMLERVPGLAAPGAVLAVAGYGIGELSRRFANRAIVTGGGGLVKWYRVSIVFGAVLLAAAFACRL